MKVPCPASRPAALAIAALTLLSTGRGARGDVGPPVPADGLWGSAGLTLGGSIHPEDGGGFLLGGEASLVVFSPGTLAGAWIGAYVDTVEDFGSDTFRVSVGPELGWGPVGVDVGWVGEVGDALVNGLQLRVLATMGYIALYGRWVHRFEAEGAPEPDIGEVGVLLKIPFLITAFGDAPRKGPPPKLDFD